MYILKLGFYLKSCPAAYFFKTILNKASLIFAFTLFLANLHTHQKILLCLMFLTSHCKTYSK